MDHFENRFEEIGQQIEEDIIIEDDNGLKKPLG